jgi:hypothetical protein
MGFFSNIKNRARGMANDLGPSNMPMAPRRVPPPPMDLDRIMRGPGLNRPDMDDGRVYAGGSPGLYAPGGRFNPGNIGGRISESSYSPLELAERKARARVEAGKQDLFQKNRKDRSKKQGGLGGLFRKLQEQIKNQQMPQQMPQQNLDFLSRLPQNMMPQVDFSNLPQMSGNPNIPAPDGYELRKDEKGMNYFQEQLSPEDQAQNMLPRRLDVPFQDFNLQNMRPGFVAGGPLSRAALSNIYRKNATARGIPVPGNLQSIYASSLPDRLRRGTENLIMGGTGAGVLLGLDGTQELREPFSKDNISVMSPEAFGKDMAQLRMDVGAVINLAKNKANEIGADINEYVSRAKQSYEQEMENKRMQELDAQQGMQPFSALLGPDMPLRRPELTEGRTTSDIDDILSSLEKKN